MNECWIVDHRIRPTFEKLTPKIKELLSDSHKQVKNIYLKIIRNKF